MADKVELIDPIESIPNLPNGTPNYEDLFIFAELLGQRRERSVLSLNSNQGKVSLETQLSNTNVNMLGVDYKKDVSESATFTTNWTNNEGSTTTLEGFGVSNIEVKINSSFMPVVNIEFVDIRGLTFFNLGENSPYGLLFDFPPPIFKMTLKGYYGKSLDYDLHLVKHSTRFDSKTGNYFISVEFIARTFAPLADVPFKFAELVSIMKKGTIQPTDPKVQEAAKPETNNISETTNQEELNFDPRVKATNTYELIEKLRRLTDELKTVKNTSKEGKEFDAANAAIREGQRIITFMNDFSGEIGTTLQKSSHIVIKNDGTNPDDNTSDNDGDFAIARGIGQYDSTIKSSNDSGNNALTQDTRLYLAILELIKREENISNEVGISEENINNALNIYKTELITLGSNFSESNLSAGSIGEPKIIYNKNPKGTVNENDLDQYIGLDVTNFYTELKKTIKSKQDIADTKQVELVEIINAKVQETLGFEPTIYNIFSILCDDVDIFFQEIGRVALAAEKHHNDYFPQIIDKVEENKSKNITKTLYPFPLFIEEDRTCGITRKTRRMPEKEKLKIDVEFPEVDFIERFINTMILIKKEEAVNDMRTQIGADRNFKWLPITPADSALNKGVGYDSPYANLSSGKNEDDVLNEFYYRLINRFYIASQYTYGQSFYSDDFKSRFFWIGDKELKRSDLIDYVAKSEAINVAISIINDNVLSSLIQKAGQFAASADTFYNAVENLSIYNEIPDNVLRLTDGQTSLINDRDNPNFVGMNIIDVPPSKRIDGSVDNNSPIELFLNEDNKWNEVVAGWFNSNNKSKIQSFTTQNIPYFPDTDEDDPYITRYINEIEVINRWFGRDDNTTRYTKIYNPFGYNVPVKGVTNEKSDPAGKNSDADYVESLSSIIALYFDEIDDFIGTGSTYTKETQAFALASLFGRGRSYFSNLGSTSRKNGSINSRFILPAIVEVPNFSVYYMGALIDYNLSGDTYTGITKLINETEWFNVVSVKGLYIKDDASKVKQLSVNDTNNFSGVYNSWVNPPNESQKFFTYRKQLRRLITKIKGLESQLKGDISETQEEIANLLKKDFVPSLVGDILKKSTILNYSEYTFQNNFNEYNQKTNTVSEYEPLFKTNKDTDGGKLSKRTANDDFFTAFWGRLVDELPERKKELDKVENDFKNSVDDEDIKTQLYYTFKNINDKWVAGIDTSAKGFPLNNDQSDPLITKFAFVDRAMNPIGDDVIIGAESLITMSQDYDLNMFQVFSRLLSLNGFEFFPLQNFMVFDNENGNWKDAFKPFTTLEQKQTPAFVCMYLGGTSSTLENSTSQFDNDGILDLDEAGLPDFHDVNGCDDSHEVKDAKTRSIDTGEARFNYSEPKAFRVRFAEQNQSFFTSIKLEGREFPETADSLAILSRIAGDGETAPVPKGQNLFNVYENRAYSVTVTMLGNAMIQPTQYFQLENIPMYSGAYMILNVKHSIKANHMITEFQGVKVLKFPNPFVKNFATLVGIESGTSEDLTGSRSAGDAISARTLPFKGEKDSSPYNNEMFSLKISP